MPQPFQPQQLVDGLFSFEAGMNGGIAALLLPKNQLALGVNTTVRGAFVTHRPAFRRLSLSYGGDATLETRFKKGFWQGGCYFKPDNGDGSLMAALSGRLFEAQITGNTATVTERAPAAPPYPNPDTRPQAWLWQSEKWCIYNDGISLPIFFDGTTSVRSNFATAVQYPISPQVTSVTAAFTVPATNALVTPVAVSDVTDLLVGDVVTLKIQSVGNVVGLGTFQVMAIAGLNLDLVNLTSQPGRVIAAGVTSKFFWSHQGTQLPPGRMGAYGMGRNWMSLVDGKQFVASDLVGGSSGTQAQNYRDAVLEVTENLYLAGGGNFTVPGSVGDIKAMRFTATLDASLGQGPLQVFTPNTVFSCNAPVDRLTWQDLTNPILTESLISNGGLSQNATVNVNGDLTFRSVDGLRSLILARRDFGTWGNVPISREVEPILRQDSDSVLQFTSSVVFDNRLLLTVGAVTDPMGVYWRGLVALNLDPVSSLRGKAPSVYDGLWTGLNTLQIITGEFEGVQRCFCWTLNKFSDEIELYEILKDGQAYYDNDTRPITWEIQTSVLDFGQKDPRKRELLRLSNGEIFVDQLLGRVDFQVFYRPDQWPCWVPWHAWSDCAKAPDPTKTQTAHYQPQYRAEMGLGEPSPTPCDETNNKPHREGYSFQIKIVFTGHCRFLGMRDEATTLPKPTFAPMVCEPICFGAEEVVTEVEPPVDSGMVLVDALEAITQNDGTVVPIITGEKQLVHLDYGQARNIADGKWYQISTILLNDGVTKAPLASQAPVPVATPYGRIYNISDGKWYTLLTVTVNGIVVPICDQTGYTTP